MKKFVVAGLALAALAAPAMAADMPVKAPMAPVAAPSNWTGFYIGGNIGAGWSRNHWSDTFVPADISTDVGTGLLGGGQIGFDYQFANTWVAGIQGMFDFSDLNTSVGQNVSCFACGLVDYSKTSWLSTLTGRLGYLVQPNMLVYAKGGAAWVQDKYSQTETIPFNPSHTVTRSGYDVGGGLEWMFAPAWSAFIEYNYANFGTVHFADFSDTTDIHQTLQTVLLGVNFRFNPGGR